MDRLACLERWRASSGAGTLIVGAGAGTGISAKCAEAAGADMRKRLRFLRTPSGAIGFGIVAFVLLVAVFGPYAAPHSSTAPIGAYPPPRPLASTIRSGTMPRRVSAANMPTCTAPRLPPPASTNAVKFSPSCRMASVRSRAGRPRYPVFCDLCDDYLARALRQCRSAVAETYLCM